MTSSSIPAKTTKNEITVKKILKRFKSNLSAIDDYFQNFGNMATDTDKMNAEKMRNELDQCFKDLNLDKKQKGEKVPLTISQAKLIFQAVDKTRKISLKNFEILSKSALLMLNNYLEYLLTDLLAYHYDKFKNSLSEKKFNVTLKDLTEYETVEELTKALITKEVESMIVEFSFDDLISHFNNKLGINREEELVNWELITECRERRHLIVHNSSIVNKKYILRTNNPFKYSIGDHVKVEKDYFLKASKEFYLAGLLLSLNSWARWDKEKITGAIKELLDDSFDLLQNQEFEIVNKLTTYSQKIESRDETQEDLIMRINFNRLISLKKTKSPLFTKELKKVKVGTASPMFKLGFAILKDDNANSIIDLVKKTQLMGDIDIDRYNEWPIYSFIRENESLNEQVKKILSKNEAKLIKVRSKKNLSLELKNELNTTKVNNNSQS